MRSRWVGRRKRGPIRRVPLSDTASPHPMGLQVGCQPFPRLIWLLFKSKQCFLVAQCLFYLVQRAQVRPIDCSRNFYSCYIGSLSSGPQAQNQLPCPNEPQYLINVDKAGQIKTRQNSSGFEPPRREQVLAQEKRDCNAVITVIINCIYKASPDGSGCYTMLSIVGSSNNKRPNKEGLQKSASAQRPLGESAGLTKESEWG